MSVLDDVAGAIGGTFDSIIGTKLDHRQNKVGLLQAGIILLVPQIAAYLTQYNEDFGIKIETGSYPVLIFVFLVVAFYVLVEPKIAPKNSEEISQVAFLSIHLFAFALSLNLIYAMLMQIFGGGHDFLHDQIANAATWWSQTPLPESGFAAIYGLPFLLLGLAMLFRNTYVDYRKSGTNLVVLFGSGLFWRALTVVILLAIYQYMAFILFDAS